MIGIMSTVHLAALTDMCFGKKLTSPLRRAWNFRQIDRINNASRWLSKFINVGTVYVCAYVNVLAGTIVVEISDESHNIRVVYHA